MPVQFAGKLLSAAELSVIPQSLVVKDGVEFAATRSGNTPQLAILAPARSPYLEQFEGAVTDHGDSKLLLGPANAANIARLRDVFEWLNPQPLGLRTSAGLGDRLGIATPGHV